jgi:nucleotide-binding universal stress UspA family protein
MYRNILLPTDGSALCRAAIEAGIGLAKALGARVTGVYAAPPATPIVYRNLLPVGYGTPKEHEEAIAKAAQKNLAAIERAAKAAGVPCDVVTMTSDFPADVILTVVKKKKCDLIVMASHSRKGLSALLLGSQTQKVLAGSPVPVLVHR